MNINKSVCVIGAGVNGLSTALLLKEHGWQVTIISKNDPETLSLSPSFASLFPAASIIPHSVHSKEMNDLFRSSQAYFQLLYEQGFPGLQINQHFELFSAETPIPSYTELMRDFVLLNSFESSFFPAHPDIQSFSGWKFSCFFADWSLYYPALLEKVLTEGVQFSIEELHKNDLSQLPYQYIINCSGLGAVDLFEDDHQLLSRGYLILVKGAPPLLNPTGNVVSYNFSPGHNSYRSENGNLQDVYCYPRSDGWIFGGSRQEGFLQDGIWVGEQLIPPIKKVDGREVPAQIFDLNAEIIQHTFGIDSSRFQDLTVKIGYRYTRKKKNGLRLETEEFHDKTVIHNYGHGGAGVTLSWGCALEVLEMLESKVG